MLRLTKSGLVRAARKLYWIPLDGDSEIGLLDPSLADVKKLQTCQEDIGGLAAVLLPLIVNEDRAPVFETADELAEALGMATVTAICEYIGKLYDRKKSEKN